MKIVYVLNSGKPGGMEKHVFDLAVGMKSRGHNVFVWCPFGPIVDWFTREEIPVIPREIKSDLDVFYIKDLVTFLNIEKCDVIHAHELKAVVNSLIAASIVGTEVRVSHTHTPITEWRVGFFNKVANIAVDTFMINVFGTTEIALTDSRKRLKRAEGIREYKLQVIPNGLDTTEFKVSSKDKKTFRKDILSRFGIDNKSHVFGNISRMSKEKGHTILLRAFVNLVKNHPKKCGNCYLLLVGGGELEEELRSEVELSGCSDRIVITGVVPREDLVKYYSAFDTFVFPTLAEGFGYVLTEAMYMELPVICSDLEVLHEVGGDCVIYFPVKNVEELEKCMYKLFAEDDVGRNIGEKAKKRVESRFSLEKFLDEYENLYKKLLSGYKENRMRNKK